MKAPTFITKLFASKTSDNNRILVNYVVVYILLILLVIILLLSKTSFYATLGPAGDFFNGVASPILQLFVISLIIKSYNLQKKELNETKAALESQANTMIEQTAAINSQNSGLKLQYFLDNWRKWSLLGDFRKTSELLTYFESEHARLDDTRKAIESINKTDTRSFISDTRHYISNILRIIEEISSTGDEFYIKILQAQLTPWDHRVIILFSCISATREQGEEIGEIYVKRELLDFETKANLPEPFRLLYEKVLRTRYFPVIAN